MDCPKCGRMAREGDWDMGIYAHQVVRNQLNPPKTPQEGMMRLALMVGSFLAKKAFSVGYQCSRCGHAWRKWF